MDSHIRVYIEANWHALGCLPPVAYKVLICLCQRADGLGRCFPSAEKIADDCGCHVQSVWSALEELEKERYIGYLRRNEQDTVTGRWLPNVYQVNPQFICIALEHQEDALRLWNGITFYIFSTTNQQQEPAPRTNKIEPAPETNNNNQRTFEKGGVGQPPQNAESPGENSKKAKSKKAKDQGDSESGENQQGAAPQRSKKRGGSAAAYKNPDAIAAPIPDVVLEELAGRVNRLGVPIGLARGFVVGYSAELVERALVQVAAAKSKQAIQNEGGFFRHLLQNNLIDSSLPEILSAQESSWAEYSE